MVGVGVVGGEGEEVGYGGGEVVGLGEGGEDGGEEGGGECCGGVDLYRSWRASRGGHWCVDEMVCGTPP